MAIPSSGAARGARVTAALVLLLASARPVAAERLLVRAYGIAEGLPDNRIGHLGVDSGLLP